MFTQVCQAIVYAVFALLLSFSTVYGVDRYVQKTGSSDSNPCTQASPCTSIHRGIGTLNSGDTLLIGNGTYDETISDVGVPSGYPNQQIPPGSAGAYTTLKAVNPGGPILRFSPSGSGLNAIIALESSNAHHIRFEGLVLDGEQQAENVRYCGSFGGSVHDLQFVNIDCKDADNGFVGGGQNIYFIGGRVHGHGYPQCWASSEPPLPSYCHGFYLQHSSVEGPWIIDGVTIDNNSGWGVQSYHGNTLTVKNSVIADNYTGGVILIGGNGQSMIYNNIFRNSPHGISCGQGCNAIHNTLYQGGGSGGIGIYGGDGSNVVIKNNLFVNYAGDQMDNQSSNPSLVAGNVCTASESGCQLQTGSATAFFVNPGAGNFRTAPGSPARGLGVSVGSPFNVDPDGVTRPQNQGTEGGSGFDAGAFEFVNGGAGPATKLLFQTQPPATIDAGDIMTSVTVRVADAGNVTVINSTATVTLTVTGGCGSTMSGYTPQVASGGTVTFSTLSFAPPGSNCTLQAASSPLASATSNPFTVTTPPVLPATYLSNFDDPAPSTEVGQVMAVPFVVALFNENNQVVTTSSAPITLSLHPNSPPGATLNCGPSTCTQNASSGQVSFNQVSLTGVTVTTSGYTFRYASPGLPNGQSGSFTITVGPVGRLTPPIKVDQFGYLPTATKVAVLSDPQTGFNAADAYTPGALTVKTSPGGTVVFSGSATAWNAGATHAQSGDKLWWFDFSSVTAPGAYIIEDATNTVQSDVFVISASVYNAVLTTALKMFYYQRSGFAKVAPYADAKWADGAAFLGANQDTQARNAADKTNAATARDVQGGWFDAGDYNKYTSNAVAPIHDLLTAYLQAPTLWTDDTNIPERLNGIPDILDEVKWELDWLLRMQTATGNGSVLSKVSVDAHQNFSPPSTDATARYWGATSTGATAVAAGAFAHGAIAFALAGQSAYATTLTNAAIAAYDWATANPNVTYANTGFLSGNPEPCTGMCLPQRVRAAIYLYGRTGTASYKTFVEAQYTNVPPMSSVWTPFGRLMQDAVLYYASLAGATSSVKTNIQNSAIAAVTNGADFVPAWTANTDGYRAYLPDANYTWGSNSTKAAAATMYTNMIAYGLDTANHTLYRRIAESYAHSLHGVNPLGVVYLSAMGAAFAERSVNELYHAWFKEGTDWQNALTSLKGPAPGYVTGGPNPGYTGNQTPPLGQPIQKAYRDWGSFDPAQEAWSISEPSIMYQGVYARLLSQLVPVPTGVATQLAFFPQPAAETVSGQPMAAIGVRILDTNGQLVSGSTLPITIALTANPSGGTLNCGAGLCTKAAVGGIATFNTLSIGTGGVTAVGPGYVLGASTTGGVTSSTSNTFSIIPVPTEPDPPTDLVISTFSTGQFIAR